MRSKITRDVLHAALTAHAGCVTGAADDLRLSRNEVYRKIRMYGLDLKGYRSQGRAIALKQEESMPPPQKVSSEAIRNALDRWEGNVKASAEELGVTRKALYDRMRRGDVMNHLRERPLQTPRLMPEQTNAVQQLRLKLQAKMNVETTNSEVLQLFFNQYFATFAAAVLQDEAPGPRRIAER